MYRLHVHVYRVYIFNLLNNLLFASEEKQYVKKFFKFRQCLAFYCVSNNSTFRPNAFRSLSRTKKETYTETNRIEVYTIGIIKIKVVTVYLNLDTYQDVIYKSLSQNAVIIRV